MPEQPNADYYDQYPVSESPAMQSVLRGIEQAAAGDYQPDPTEPQTWAEVQKVIDARPKIRVEWDLRKDIEDYDSPPKPEHSGR